LHQVKKTILFLIILFTNNCGFAQSWQWAKQIGGPGLDHAFIGYIDSQQNSYVYGWYAMPFVSTYNNCYLEDDTLYGSNDSFLAKYDEDGNLVWVKNCFGPSNMGIGGFAFDMVNSVFG
jgi:hypothetical protein